MKIKKTIEIEETICDICNSNNVNKFMYTCNYCKRDICSDCTRIIMPPMYNPNVGDTITICTDCLKKIDEFIY